jgi:hypothetical protein
MMEEKIEGRRDGRRKQIVDELKELEDAGY